MAKELNKTGYVIGIDPDVDKNGYALIELETRKVTVCTVTLPQLLYMVEVIRETAVASGKPLKVYVEAGWLNQSNWHLTRYDTKQSAAAKGKAQGRNHQRGMDIIELLQTGGVDVTPVAPLKKLWHGKDRKITHAELTRIMGDIKHTNQEGRDAALLAWVHANLPIRL